VREAERLEREAAAIRAELAVALRDLGLDASDPVRAAAELERRVAAERDEDERAARGHAAAETLRRLLDGDSVEGLERRLAAARDELRARVGPGGAIPSAGDPGDREGLRQRVRERAGAARTAALDAAALRERVREREEQLAAVDAAELEERLEDLGRRIAGIERAGRAIRIARDALEDAARDTHRRFAPHLRDALVRHLPTITNGRYRDALVAEDLTLQVRAPESGEYVSVEDLSRGTRDQIYLLERLEIARLLDPTTGEAPLFLDDPFARSDATRVRLGLRVLREFAVQRQVVLFSEDPELARAARRIADGCVVIELPPPGAEGPAVPVPPPPPAPRSAAAPRPERSAVRDQADLWATAGAESTETTLGRPT
jgi:DNA repair exonuclease SbcCD ATPase subunit